MEVLFVTMFIMRTGMMSCSASLAEQHAEFALITRNAYMPELSSERRKNSACRNLQELHRTCQFMRSRQPLLMA
jgi:hypothetical protein